MGATRALEPAKLLFAAAGINVGNGEDAAPADDDADEMVASGTVRRRGVRSLMAAMQRDGVELKMPTVWLGRGRRQRHGKNGKIFDDWAGMIELSGGD